MRKYRLMYYWCFSFIRIFSLKDYITFNFFIWDIIFKFYSSSNMF